MNAGPRSSYCLATITDDAFSIATEVLLYSFLKENPWFAGDLLVIEDDLSDAARARIAGVGRVTFLRPDPRLERQTEVLRGKLPALQAVYRRFYSFEIFRLTAYSRVVYLDSDICCTGSVEPLFTSTEPLLACPDGFTYGDRIRVALSNGGPDAPAPKPRYGGSFAASFNAGVLSIGPPVLGEESYASLLALLDLDTWLALGPSKFTDQMALNICFENHFCELPAIYNYMLFIDAYQRICEPFSPSDARLIHFAGPIKPWNEYDPIALLQRAPQFARFIELWRDLLRECRGARTPTAMAAAYEQQKAWIDAFNRDPLLPTGRLY